MRYRVRCDTLLKSFIFIKSWGGAILRMVGETFFRCYFFETCILVLYILLGVLVVPWALVFGFYKIVRYLLAKAGGAA